MLELRKPDDWHVHLRDGDALAVTVPATARCFGRAIVMPNLPQPVTTVEAARAYRERILKARPETTTFAPLMTLYLTQTTTVEEIARAKADDCVAAVKLYPAGATTHSAAGVRHLDDLSDVLDAMADANLPLLVHGEVVDENVDVFDREAVFIERVLAPLVDRHPALKVVLEHITTADAVQFVRDAPARVAATITAHHLLLNRNALFTGGIRPHHYCLPVLKRERHRRALLEAATSGLEKFFLGTDSAPHERVDKESACGCAGLFTAHGAIELYACAFEQMDALDKLEGFASRHGPAFYGLSLNAETIRLERRPWRVPPTLPYCDGALVPYLADEEIPWRMTA